MAWLLGTLSEFFAGFGDTTKDAAKAAPAQKGATDAFLNDPLISMLLEGEGVTREDVASTVDEIRKPPADKAD